MKTGDLFYRVDTLLIHVKDEDKMAGPVATLLCRWLIVWRVCVPAAWNAVSQGPNSDN